jgi:hypothetical protein
MPTISPYTEATTETRTTATVVIAKVSMLQSGMAMPMLKITSQGAIMYVFTPPGSQLYHSSERLHHLCLEILTSNSSAQTVLAVPTVRSAVTAPIVKNARIVRT